MPEWWFGLCDELARRGLTLKPDSDFDRSHHTHPQSRVTKIAPALAR